MPAHLFEELGFIMSALVMCTACVRAQLQQLSQVHWVLANIIVAFTRLDSAAAHMFCKHTMPQAACSSCLGEEGIASNVRSTQQQPARTVSSNVSVVGLQPCFCKPTTAIESTLLVLLVRLLRLQLRYRSHRPLPELLL
jgi:hypothetical protein